MLSRRGLLAGLGAALAAPAIIRTPGLLMPVKLLRLGPPAGVFYVYGFDAGGNFVKEVIRFTDRDRFALGHTIFRKVTLVEEGPDVSVSQLALPSRGTFPRFQLGAVVARPTSWGVLTPNWTDAPQGVNVTGTHLLKV